MIHSFRVDIHTATNEAFPDSLGFNYRIFEKTGDGEETVLVDRTRDLFPNEDLALRDSLLYLELATMRGPGRWRVWYMRPDHFRTFIVGDTLPMAGTLMQTHVALRCVDVVSMEQVFGYMQGENWSPNGEARRLIEQKGLQHTSMSVGDVIEDLPTGDFFAVGMIGFKKL